ncbi:hypothetical protein CRG98_028963 [Punica granatum]|uniref:Uncharacterized protein n=1 Tax=Punica granatum TaxID=22663 RepID=A0A2I0J342_PUNGR|nr:hypothetical protein CRG98_028963 [Punica granatum]
MNCHLHQHQTSDRGLPADQILEEENRQKKKLLLTSEGIRDRTSSSTSSSSFSPPQDFSFPDNGRTNGNSLLLSAKAVEMTPADEIFFHGHLLPLRLLSHFSPISYSSPRSSTDYLDSFTLPIGEEYLPDDDLFTSMNGSSCSSSTDSNFKGKMVFNPAASPKTSSAAPSSVPGMVSAGAVVSPLKFITILESDMRERDDSSKPFSLFGLSRWRRACKARGDEGKQKKKFRFHLNRTVRRYVKMARPLLFFRRKRREEDIDFQAEKFGLSATETFSAPASIRTSPRSSGLLVKTPALSAAVTDSTVEELQAAIQAAIAYCKKLTVRASGFNWAGLKKLSIGSRARPMSFGSKDRHCIVGLNRSQVNDKVLRLKRGLIYSTATVDVWLAVGPRTSAAISRRPAVTR